MAPLAYNPAILKEQQTGIASDYGLQRRSVGETERIFRAGDVPPVPNRLFATGCQAIEPVVALSSANS